MIQKETNKSIWWLRLSAGLFLLLFLILSYYNRIVYEDYSGVVGNEHYGVWQNAVNTYNAWGGNLFSFALGYLVLSLFPEGSLFVYHFCELILLFFAFKTILKNGSAILFDTRLEEENTLSLLLTGLLFFCTVQPCEGWFWVLASTNYLVALGFALFGFGLSLRRERSAFHDLLIVILFIYVGAASEPFAMLCLFFCTCFIAVAIYKSQKISLIVYFILFALIIGFAFTEFAPGTVIRKSAMPEISMFTAFERCMKAIVKYWLFEFKNTVPGFLGAVALGTLLSGKTKVKIGTSNFLMGLLIGFNILLFLSFLPVCYIMGEAGPYRSWHHIGFYTMIAGILLGISLGQKYILIKPIHINIYICLFSLFIGFRIITQVPVLNKFAYAYDDRIEWLRAMQQSIHRPVEKIEMLPSSGMLYSQDCDQDTAHYSYKYFHQYLNIGYHFKVADK